jgi:hypothetical protein
MASGHVYRARRPNTWPLRPTPQSEDSTCQPGAVHTWPIAPFRFDPEFGRYRGIADDGPDLPLANPDANDPGRVKTPKRKRAGCPL